MGSVTKAYVTLAAAPREKRQSGRAAELGPNLLARLRQLLGPTENVPFTDLHGKPRRLPGRPPRPAC